MIADEQILLKWQLEVELQEQEEKDDGGSLAGKCIFCGVYYGVLHRHKSVCIKNPRRAVLWSNNYFHNETMREYYHHHPERYKRYSDEYLQNPRNREKINQRKAAYRHLHREEIREYNRAYRRGIRIPLIHQVPPRDIEIKSDLPRWDAFRMIDSRLPTPQDPLSQNGVFCEKSKEASP